jgi:hypothetical protein
LSIARRNPYVAQTQILMAVVAGAMMMVVGDSAARAFWHLRRRFTRPLSHEHSRPERDHGVAGLSRRRTGIRRRPLGHGRYPDALRASRFDAVGILRTVPGLPVDGSVGPHTRRRQNNEMLKRLFARHGFDSELLGLNRQDPDEPMGKIVYLVNLDTMISTSKLSDEVLSSDPDNVDSVEWEQKDSKTYIYK